MTTALIIISIVFNAGLVLFAALLVYSRCRGVKTPVLESPEMVRDSLHKAVETLRLLDEGNKTVKKCYECLKRLSNVEDLIGMSSPSTNPALFQLQLWKVSFASNHRQLTVQP